MTPTEQQQAIRDLLSDYEITAEASLNITIPPHMRDQPHDWFHNEPFMEALADAITTRHPWIRLDRFVMNEECTHLHHDVELAKTHFRPVYDLTPDIILGRGYELEDGGIILEVTKRERDLNHRNMTLIKCEIVSRLSEEHPHLTVHNGWEHYPSIAVIPYTIKPFRSEPPPAELQMEGRNMRHAIEPTPCEHCEGTGNANHNCSDCYGSGMFQCANGVTCTCSTCYGGADCEHCNGTGDAPTKGAQ